MADAARLGGENTISKSLFGNAKDLFIAVAVIAIVVMLIIPLPTVLLDTLMALNLVFSLLILLMFCIPKNRRNSACSRRCCW